MEGVIAEVAYSRTPEYHRAWRARRKDKLNELARARYARNGNDLRAKAAVRRAENREKLRAKGREFRERNPGYHRALYRKNHVRMLLSAAKKRAKARGMEFNLMPGDIVIPATCPVLGIPLAVGDGAKSDSSPSIDRIRNELGYTKGNVIVVSLRANRIKADATLDELRVIADFYSKLQKASV